jgi:hypothetical protein
VFPLCVYWAASSTITHTVIYSAVKEPGIVMYSMLFSMFVLTKFKVELQSSKGGCNSDPGPS